MHLGKLWVEDYFDIAYTRRGNFKKKEWDEINYVRSRLNSFQYEDEQARFLYDRRKSSYYRRLDERLFGVPYGNEIDPNDYGHSINKYYNPADADKFKNTRDYYKRNRDGTVKRDKYGNAKQYGKFGKAMVNFQNNMANSKIGKAAKFAIAHWMGILIAIGVISLAFSLIIMAIYISGVANSLGHTPFVLCSDDQIAGDAPVVLPDADVDSMATLDYAANAFISVAKSAGWKDNAIVGTLSYILQEGGGMGTFTYESYYCMAGPSGDQLDLTLNNDAWLSWMDGKSGGFNTGNPNAIGIGIFQWTNNYGDGTRNATRLINAANEAGVPWQDPAFQMDFAIQDIMSKTSDSDWKDPTTFTGSAEEYCRRVTAFIGMPGWSYTTNNSYMQAHTKHIPEAESLYENATGIEIGSLSQNSSINLCEGADSVITGGNATIADAAVSLASGTEKIMWDGCDGSNCPALNRSELATYKKVHEAVYPNDVYFASCDRSAGSAIRWSGADIDFPAGATGNQWNYLNNSDKWQYVGEYGSCELQPGDVLITHGNGHIKIYVGNEAVKKRFPDSNADMYAGSFHDYFPRVYKDDPSYDSRAYAVFRCVNPDNSDKWKNI